MGGSRFQPFSIPGLLPPVVFSGWKPGQASQQAQTRAMRHFWGTIKVSPRSSYSFQTPQSTQLLLQLLLLLPPGRRHGDRHGDRAGAQGCLGQRQPQTRPLGWSCCPVRHWRRPAGVMNAPGDTISPWHLPPWPTLPLWSASASHH